HSHLCGDVKLAVLFLSCYLEHDDLLVAHAAVVKLVSLSYEGESTVFKEFLLSVRHDNLPSFFILPYHLDLDAGCALLEQVKIGAERVEIALWLAEGGVAVELYGASVGTVVVELKGVSSAVLPAKINIGKKLGVGRGVLQAQ